MKIEKLRKNHKKEIIIGTILTVVIGGALTFKLTHSKYRTTQSINLATGTINYTVPDFKIMAMYKSEDGENYTEMAPTERMPGSGYVIDESKSYCNLNGSKDTSAVLKTIDGNHVVSNLIKGDKCYLYFKKGSSYAADVILANITYETTTPDFSQIATSDEVVFETTDGMYDNGKTYYWRGAASTNYVKFAGLCWRIIRINGDKTIRMIYDGTTCHANGTNTTESLAQPTSGTIGYAYNPTYNASYYVGWTYSSSQRPSSTNNDGNVGTASNAKTQLQTWYNANLKSYEGKIAEGKYCNDRDTEAGGSTGWVSTGTSFNYAARGRLETNKNPTFNCSNAGDVYTLKVGLITADEVAFAGGKYYASDGSSNNASYYLYNGNHYWTMSPYNWSGTYARVFRVDSYGYLDDARVDWTGGGLRPVINLKADTTFALGGTGTQNNPYVVQ